MLPTYRVSSSRRQALKSSVLNGIVGLALMGNIAGAAAQDGQLGIEEIIVHATKRGAVSAQDIAAGITAFDESKLDRLGAIDFDEFIVHVPGTNFIDNGGPGRGHEVASIRGLSPVADNTVSVVSEYLDGAPRFGRNYTMFDIGEASVLRGPQGTLWGSQAVGGLISYRSNRPDFDGVYGNFESDIYATDSAGMSYRMSGVTNIPVVEDKFALRIAGQYIDESGYVDNNIVGEKNINDVEEFAWRVSALFTPNEDISFTVIYHGNDLDTGAPSYFNIGAGDRVSTDALTDLWGKQKFDLINVIAEFDFDWASLSYSGSYYDMSNDYIDVERAVFGFLPLGRTTFTTEEESWTHEIRLSSNGDGPLNWIIGVYHDDFDSNNLSQQFEIADPNDPNWAAGVFEGFEILKIGGPETFKETAVFGEVSYDVTEEFSLLVGGRYFDWEVGNEQELTYFAFNYNQVTGKTGGDDFFFKVQANYTPTDDILVYLTRGEGFRFGGFNPFVGLPGITAEFSGFDPDKLVNYELGFKSQWQDNRLVLNAAVYFMDWQNIQTVVFPAPPNTFAFTTNGPDLESKGMELEIVSQDLLFPGFYGALSYSYNKNSFQEDAVIFPGAPALIEKGEELRRTPRHTWSRDVGYDFKVDDYDAFVRANYWHKQATTTEGFNGGDGNVPIPAQNVVNMSAGISIDEWSVRLYVDNLTNATPLLQVFPSNADPSLPARASSIRPRTIGLQLKYKFGG